MTNQEVRAYLLKMLSSQIGDGYYRAKHAFRNCTPEQMQEKYGFSGETRQEVLDEYKNHDEQAHEVRRWITENVK